MVYNNSYANSYYPPNNNQYFKPVYVDTQQRQNAFMLKGHPVASFDEAKISMIDFDGSIFYFPDLANRCIYTKQINPDGSASFAVYEQKEIVEPTPIKSEEYVTKSEFEQAIAELKTGAPSPQETSEPVQKSQDQKPHTYNF